ncbi:MAG TPA: NIPSNAP family protein [Chloroflexota bacterium]
MIAQLRIYTVKPGMLDSFVGIFRESLAPLHEQYGIRILGAWVNREANEFIWMRAFPDEASIESMTRTYETSPERKAIGDRPRSHLEKLEVRLVEPVWEPASR